MAIQKIIKWLIKIIYLISFIATQASGATVTFHLDMQGQIVAEDGIFLAGGNWHNNRQAMTPPPDGETIWTLAIPIEDGEHMYKFQNGAGNYEIVPPQCGYGQYDDRMVNVNGSDIDLDIVCFSSCNPCPPLENKWRTAVFSNDQWKYILPNMELPHNWNTIDYDDSQWTQGEGGFGYSDGDDGTIIEPTNSVFIRKTFFIEDLSILNKAVLSADYDDGYVAFLNGEEIGRSENLNYAGDFVPFDANTSYDHEASLYNGGLPENILIDSLSIVSLLNNGSNVLAIQVHNVDLNSSDMSSNFFLTFKMVNNSSLYRDPPGWFQAPISFYESNLPIILIDTYGEEIIDDPRIPAYMGIIDNQSAINHIDDPFNGYDGHITIEKRGNSSQGQPKPPYRFETVDNDGENNNVEILGMPAENDWVLYAPWQDKTMIRNILIYKLSNELGRYASKTRFVELYLNQEYRGVYVLMEKIKRDSERVAISKLNPDEISGDDVTGGYILKFDWYNTGDNNGGFESPNDGIIYNYHYPKPDEIVPEQKQYIQNYIYDFENIMLSEDYTNDLSGYPSIIDVESFIDFILLQELAKNVDAYRLSSYIYKDKESVNNKLHAGPIWDFNHGFGNCNYGETWETHSWLLDYNPEGGDQVSFWWELLWQDENFKVKAAQRYSELRSGIFSNNNINSIIDSAVAELGNAIERNFTKWQLLGTYVWPNYYVFDTYDEEINYLKFWTQNRLSWMDDQFLQLKISNEIILSDYKIIKAYPNPFNHNITFQFNKNDNSITKIDIFNILGKKVKTINNFSSNPGVQKIFWDATHDDGREVASGIYIYIFNDNKSSRKGTVNFLK